VLQDIRNTPCQPAALSPAEIMSPAENIYKKTGRKADGFTW